MEVFLVVVSGLYGLIFGSFMNVAVYRLPRKESLTRPGSHCPCCGAPIRARDNIPVLSYLLLRGRCRDCRAPISIRYPLIELATGVLFAGVAAKVGASWALPAYLWFAWALLALALIDAGHRILPNRLTYPTAIAGLVLLVIPVLAGEAGWGAYGGAVLAGLVAGGGFLLLAVIRPGGMGMGDVKLAAVLGLYLGFLGWRSLVVGLFAGFLLGGVSGLVLIGSGKRSRKDMIPFGPFLALGGLVGLFAGSPLAEAYSHLLGR